MAHSTPCPGPASLGRPWHLYLIECADGSYYAGITIDADARFAAHCSGVGAKYTRAHPPVRLRVVAEYPNRSEASKAEYALKQLDHAQKTALFEEAARAAGEDARNERPVERERCSA